MVDAESLPPGETAWEYLAVVFDTHGLDIPITIEYDERRTIHLFTQDLLVQGVADDATGRVTVFFPVYEASTLHDPQLLLDFLDDIDVTHWREAIIPNTPIEEQAAWRRSKFIGVTFPAAYQELFAGLYSVHTLDELKLLPLFQLPEERSFIRPYKTGPWERALRACWTNRRQWSKPLLGVLLIVMVLGFDWTLSRQKRSCRSPRR